MTTLTPSDALILCETSLRSLMTHVYEQTYGSDWLARVADARQEAWNLREREEAAARGSRGVVSGPAGGLNFANFYDLIGIADKHWEPVSAALGKKAETMALLRRLDRARNAIAHSRTLLPFERELVSGIAGQIRNQVTLFMSSTDAAGDIYPRIEAAVDSYGRSIGTPFADREVAGAVNRAPFLIVHPGDVVAFECSGTDPQGRNLNWTLAGADYAERVHRASASGEIVTLEWSVQDDDVQEQASVTIWMGAAGTRFHRAGTFDQRVYFFFHVRPR